MDKEHILQLLKDRSIIDKSISDCYCYRGYVTPAGYGSLNLPEGKFLVHRLSAWIHLDYDLDSKEQVNHSVLCVSKSCWNPDHLKIGSQQDNIRDAIISGTHVSTREKKTECKRGHSFEEYGSLNSKGVRICTECAKIYIETRKRKNQQQQQQ